MKEEDWGLIFTLACVAAAGWWLWNKYEIVERAEKASPPIPLATPAADKRPTGSVFVTELDDGSVWSLNANSVRGPRDKRIGWVVSDNTKNKKVSSREVQTLYQVNCENTGFRTLTVIEYGKEGKVLNNWREEVFSKDNDFAPPTSNMGSVISLMCGKEFDADPLGGN